MMKIYKNSLNEILKRTAKQYLAVLLYKIISYGM